jgi:lipopolysaccharide transport system ATP-binding protein
MSDVLVSVDNVSKKFCRSLKSSLWYGVKDMASEMLGLRSACDLRPDEFWAIKDVSFELKRGECLGLIGRNGAGKTSLLRMLNGLIKPDQGRIEMRGRVGALIALGAGFNPILTGRENIYVNASVIGLSKHEIDKKLDEIIDFAEIEEFIDSPVQSYSSGMQVRLGFAVATALEPDILLLDEVLAVGDLRFRTKCFNKIHKIIDNCAVLFVSHNMEDIFRLCSRVYLMERGRPVFIGTTADGIKRYIEFDGIHDESNTLIVGGDYLDVKITDVSVTFIETTVSGRIDINANITAKESSSEIAIVWFILNSDGRNICVSQPIPIEIDVGKSYLLSSSLMDLKICPGIYKLGVNVIKIKNKSVLYDATDNLKYDLLASFRNLHQFTWQSDNIIQFGASIYMNSRSAVTSK